MKIYSNGKDRVLKGDFPTRFKLLNAGVEVPYIRTGKQSVRLSGDIPFGELDVEEIVRKKIPQPAKLGAESIAIINKKDFDQIDILSKKLTINQEKMSNHLSALTEQEATLANLETQNAQAIDQTNLNMVEMAKAFGKEIQADRDALVATSENIKQVISETAEVIDAKLQAHEVAKNPHKITKGTVGLGSVDNTSDQDKPVSRATQEALDKKADRSDIDDVRKEIKATEKKQERLVKAIDGANLVGGVGGNELPTGGKKGQILAKKSGKTGDYDWVDNPVVKKHNDLTGRDSADCHPISSIIGLQSALDNKEPTISDLQQIRENATAGKSASETIATYGDIVTHNTNEFATAEQGSLADTAIQPNDNISELNNDAGYITSSALNGYATEQWVGQQGFLTSTALSGYATETWVQNQGYLTGITSSDVTTALGYTPYDSSNPDGYITNSALSNYVTLNTMQTLTSAKKMFATDATMAGNQTAMLATISNNTTKTTDNAWVGRYICGAKNLTFLMGTYRTMAGIGVHTWTNAQTGAGAGWGDFYLNPDGDKTVYIGGYGWTKNSGLLKVKNSGSNSVGTVQVNKGTVSSASWKDVAYKGENVSHFNNDANYITSSAINNPTITITQGGVTKGSFTLNQSTGDTIALDAGGGGSLPTQTGHSGEFLTTNGTDASWAVATTVILRRL